MSEYYITTAIHYVNDLPHIGHIYENVIADVMARYRRLIGDEVYFLTGTDEHGQKIERSAAREGIKPIELADRVVENHHALWKDLGITHDDFIRTTEDRHRAGVYELIRRIRENNPDDLYMGEHTGWYCSNEEAFVPDNQAVDGKCPEGHAVEQTKEKNLFFRLSRYQEPLLEHFRRNPDFIFPRTRYNEVVSFVEQGLRDLSVSRTSISWGIPFPEEEDHVIYVWMDALTNYISALGFGSGDTALMEKYWPANVHLIGKDIVRFHAVYWPAFLMAAGVQLPKQIVAHGWWLRDDQKISKSTGNIVRPNHIIDNFGADPLRYYLVRDMIFGQDANYSDEAFIDRYNAELANDLGNTLSRSIKMSASYFEGRTPPSSCMVNPLRDASTRATSSWLEAMGAWDLAKALEAIRSLMDEITSYIVTREPWKRFRENGADPALARIIWNILEAQRIAWTMLHPVMPTIAADALRRLGAVTEEPSREQLKWGQLATKAEVIKGDSLFPRVDRDQFLESLNEEKDKENQLDDNSKHDGPPIETTQAANPAATADLPADEENKQQTPPQGETTQAQPPTDGLISIDKFFETKLMVAQIISAEKIEKSNKLLKLRVSTGDRERTIVAGIAKAYDAEQLPGRKIVIVANLQPAMLMGVESQGMILAAEANGVPSLLAVDEDVAPGTTVR